MKVSRYSIEIIMFFVSNFDSYQAFSLLKVDKMVNLGRDFTDLVILPIQPIRHKVKP